MQKTRAQQKKKKFPYPEMPYSRDQTMDDSNGEKTLNSELKKTCNENFNQYLLNTTLHGLRYVGDRSITLFER